jgi:hypothetical protein
MGGMTLDGSLSCFISFVIVLSLERRLQRYGWFFIVSTYIVSYY